MNPVQVGQSIQDKTLNITTETKQGSINSLDYLSENSQVRCSLSSPVFTRTSSLHSSEQPRKRPVWVCQGSISKYESVLPQVGILWSIKHHSRRNYHIRTRVETGTIFPSGLIQNYCTVSHGISKAMHACDRPLHYVLHPSFQIPQQASIYLQVCIRFNYYLLLFACMIHVQGCPPSQSFMLCCCFS